jgi:probable rRNA maturation factor
MKHLQLRNRQRDRSINLPLLRQICTALLEDLLNFSEYELAIHFVSARMMTQLNEKFLNHIGPTDVITFDFREGYDPALAERQLAGEIYICVAVAEKQAVEFATTWKEEVARYIAHGVLHLIGHDDLVLEKRRQMKREENRLVKTLSRRFDFSAISR